MQQGDLPGQIQCGELGRETGHAESDQGPYRRPTPSADPPTGVTLLPIHVLGERAPEDDHDQTDHTQGESDRIELDHARVRVIGT